MANLSTKTFTANGTFTPPAGVTSINVITSRNTNYIGQDNAWIGVPSFIDALGIAYAWGENTHGQTGTNSSASLSSPVAVVGGLSNIRKLAMNGWNMRGGFILDGNGKAYWLGTDSNQAGTAGQGVSTITTASSPVAVVGGKNFIDIQLLNWTGNFMCAFALTEDGTLFSWGGNNKGQLGVGDVVSRSSPVAVVGGQKFQYPIPLCMNSAMVMLNTAGTAYAWGINTNGQLGVGDVVSRSSPVAVLGGLTFKKVVETDSSGSDGGSSFVGLTTAGALYGWGANFSGCAGVGDNTPRSSPVAVVGVNGVTFVDLISVHGNAYYALDSLGRAWAWGNNPNGNLGTNDVTPRSSPVQVVGGLTFTKLWAMTNGGGSPFCTFGLTSAGDLYAWGANTNGQLGVGDVVSRSSPVAVLGGLTFATVASVGHNDSDSTSPQAIMGITTSGAVYAWGKNSSGGCGLGDVTPRSSPVAVLGGLIAKVFPNIRTTQLTVTPGTAYSVTFTNQTNVVIGTTVVDAGPCDSVTIQYEQ